MAIGFMFWLLMVLWLVFGFWMAADTTAPNPRYRYGLIGGNLLLFILLFLLDWKTLGFIIQG